MGKCYDISENDKFIEEVFELAFGDNAINKGYTREEVLEKLREFSDNALKVEEWDMQGNDKIGG